MRRHKSAQRRRMSSLDDFNTTGADADEAGSVARCLFANIMQRNMNAAVTIIDPMFRPINPARNIITSNITVASLIASMGSKSMITARSTTNMAANIFRNGKTKKYIVDNNSALVTINLISSSRVTETFCDT
mmetsp:Transcript_13653/g.16939  ORF Transcript_13653/g.16939 Transcript_13653/m.16939 type:complete len:132 (-) Transcript_13653:234-629(-)